MFAAFIGGWEIVIILAIVVMMGLGVLIGLGAIVWLLYRQQKRAVPPMNTQQNSGQ
jgi:hypothetical protein